MGLMATSVAADNYHRVWSRDSNMTGIAGYLAADNTTIEAWRLSLDTLRDHQHEAGFIPSNVGGATVSYGSLVGRVDSTLWYIIGVALCHRAVQDDTWRDSHLPAITKALALCEAWEFNGRHLVYTPLSGNWADEYPIQGYTLYDNCLRLWGLRLWGPSDLVEDEKLSQVEQAIESNFWLTTMSEDRYHRRLYDDESKVRVSRYWEAGFSPGRYYRMFDAAGNGLALLLGLGDDLQVSSIDDYLQELMSDLGHHLVPAFWPVINPGDELDSDLRQNYAYSFKNVPHHFHNGGIWPIMMGWLAIGLRSRGQVTTPDQMLKSYKLISAADNYQYHEYLDSKHFAPGGKLKMCYSASGALMMLSTLPRIRQALL